MQFNDSQMYIKHLFTYYFLKSTKTICRQKMCMLFTKPKTWKITQFTDLGKTVYKSVCVVTTNSESKRGNEFFKTLITPHRHYKILSVDRFA